MGRARQHRIAPPSSASHPHRLRGFAAPPQTPSQIHGANSKETDAVRSPRPSPSHWLSPRHVPLLPCCAVYGAHSLHALH
jgi:hypothetical protein